MNSKRIKAFNALPWIGILLWIAIAILYCVKAYFKKDYTDFDVYLRAASRAVSGQWLEIYNLADGASPYRYLPIIIPFFVPFTWFSPEWAKVAWCFFQWLSFSLGFLFLYQVLWQNEGSQRHSRWGLHSKKAQLALGLGVLAALRLFLDSLSIGQVAGPMFFGYSLALWAWVKKRPTLYGAAIAIPMLLKISPGIFFLLPLTKSWDAFVRSLRGALIVFLGATFILVVWITLGTEHTVIPLLRELSEQWLQMVRMDSVYYDASHYGSQSLWSALLRASQWGWFDFAQAAKIRLLASGLILTMVLMSWLSRKSRQGSIGLAGEFALGLYLPMLLMPETFKYSLTPLVIPFAIFGFSFTRLKPGFEKRMGILIALFTICTLSLAGKDLLDPFHPRLFFWIQEKSFPFLCVFAGFLFLLFLHWQRSEKRFFIKSTPSILPPIDKSPLHDTLTLFVVATADRANLYLQKFVHQSLNIPTGALLKWLDPKDLAAELSQCPSKWIGFVNPEQVPFSGFYQESLRILQNNPAVHLVRANRRDQQSRFQIPVKSFSHVYFRHQLGRILNRIFKNLFQISPHDTQSGICVMRKETLMGITPFLSADDFMQPLEWSLILKALGIQEREIPVEFRLFSEKTSSQVLEECFSILHYLPKLFWHYRLRTKWLDQLKGLKQLDRVTADDWGLSRGVNEAVLDLAQRGVLKRTSAMVDLPGLHTHLAELAKVPDFQIGLHFNLTYRNLLIPNANTPLKFLIFWMKSRVRGDLRQSLADRVREELEHQIGALRNALEPLGRKIDYLDGHHHVHVFPGIMEICAPILKHHQIQHVRIPLDRRYWIPPLLLLNFFALGARGAAKRNGLSFESVFYPLPGMYAKRDQLARAVAVHANREIISHPAARDDVKDLIPPDPYSSGRVAEYTFWQWLSITQSLVSKKSTPENA